MAKTNRLSLGTLIQIFAAAALLATSACKRAGDEISSFSIKIPTAEQLSSKNSVQSVVDYNLLCFAIDIQGGSIPSTSANTCQPVKGQMLGSVAPGQTLQGRINEGTYTFKVYALKRTNAAQACPAVTADSWNFPLAKVYYAGETANQKIAGETANIELQITLPDESTNMIAHNSFPATCNLIGAPAQSTAGKIPG